MTERDVEKLSSSYSIDDGPVAKGAVSNYIGVVKLSVTESDTMVEWSSIFGSSNENDVVELCDPIYQALLSTLKQTLS